MPATRSLGRGWTGGTLFWYLDAATQTPVVPFFIDQIYQGFATARGLASMTSHGLTLEFEVKDAGRGADAVTETSSR